MQSRLNPSRYQDPKLRHRWSQPLRREIPLHRNRLLFQARKLLVRRRGQRETIVVARGAHLLDGDLDLFVVVY